MIIFINMDGIIINPKNEVLSEFQSRIILEWKSFIENKENYYSKDVLSIINNA